jgi:hypothetical protein
LPTPDNHPDAKSVTSLSFTIAAPHRVHSQNTHPKIAFLQWNLSHSVRTAKLKRRPQSALNYSAIARLGGDLQISKDLR